MGGATVNSNRSTANITIAESSSPRGLLGYASLDGGTVEQGGTYVLTALRQAGTFGTVS